MRVCLALVAFFLTAQAFAQTSLNSQQEQRAHALNAELRCLVCQNQSIEDSNAQLAQDLRALVREHIASGKSDADIRSFLVKRYGDFVLLKPPLKPETYLLWGAPLLVLLLSLILIWRVRANRQGAAPILPLSPQEQEKLKRMGGEL